MISPVTKGNDVVLDKSGYLVYIYTPDIQSMWEYIVFAFPFVSPFIRLSITGSKFLR